MDRGIGVGPGRGLDDILAFDLEEDVIGGEWSHGLGRRCFGKVGCRYSSDGFFRFACMATGGHVVLVVVQFGSHLCGSVQ